MNILGVGSPFGHDPAAALLVDGKVVAAVEEERLIRLKHAVDKMPLRSIEFCLGYAGLSPRDIDVVAYPWSYQALRDKRGEYLWRTIWAKPSRAYKKFFRCRRELAIQKAFLENTLACAGFKPDKTRIRWVEHHLAHAASAFYLSGFGRAAVLSIDGGGEITATLLAAAQGNHIRKIKEIIAPDSLGNFYSTLTDYLGFCRQDGEYKVMGMAPYGETSRVDFGRIIYWKNGCYHCNDDYVWVARNRRARPDKVYSRKMVEEFGPPREGDGLSEPYIHIAAATQDKLEEMALRLIETYLADTLRDCQGRLVFAGGCALNVSLNRKIIGHPLVKRLWVQPASNDSGSALGAAVEAAVSGGEDITPMDNVYLGPEFDAAAIERELKKAAFVYRREGDIADAASRLLEQGEVVGWFQGRAEWGPRALGNRSILGNPTIAGTADKINAMIKFREKWRPFCPAILAEHAGDILGSNHPAPFMTFAFEVAEGWRKRIAEVVHVDGTARPQIVDEQTNPLFYRLLKSFYARAGVPVVINTSLNRRGEPMVCSPADALMMFSQSGLQYLAMGEYLLSKKSLPNNY
ncbi:MAG: carbamoyltransferase [Candidatus Omnitrophota bacterium]